ncbi:MAG: type II secretion system F family protein [Arenimonas sp.]
MPLFRYKALSSAGENLVGQMEATSSEEVIARLQEQGHLPIEAQRSDNLSEQGNLFSLFRKSEMSDAQVLQFTQQLATLLGAGQPLDKALGVLLELPESASAKKILERIRESVRGGGTLSNALEQQHGLFSRLMVNMVRAGEAGGGLQISLTRVAEYLERSREFRMKLINALIYPCILMLMVVIAFFLLFTLVLPQFESLFEDFGAEIPWYTSVLMWVSHLVRDWWWVPVPLLLLAGYWLHKQWQNPAWRLAVDQRILNSRLFGVLVARIDTARFARTLGTLVQSGVPLLHALNLSRPVLFNQVLGQSVDVASNEVKTGSGLAYALAKQKSFPRLAVQMIQVGEESGELDVMLLKVADTFDTEANHSISRLMAALLPVLTLLMTLMVFCIILAVLLPIFNLTGAVV